MDKDFMTFDYEWLSLDKNDFRLLVMIIDLDGNIGSLSQMCRYFGLSEQTTNKNNIRNGLEELKQKGIIEYGNKGRKWSAKIIKPIAEEIKVKREYVLILKERKYERSVAWVQVLKCYLWLFPIPFDTIFTRKECADVLGVSDSTVGEAFSALEEYGAIQKERINIKVAENAYHTVGLKIDLSAWWKEI